MIEIERYKLRNIIIIKYENFTDAQESGDGVIRDGETSI
jgi:hypothetical protein